MKNERIEILQKVANGKLSPEQADERLLGLSIVSKSFAEGVKVKIVANTRGHNFEDGDIVTLIEREGDMWLAESELGETWWIAEHEANVC